jgi:cytoskeletal protein CcmA (bactofilin family)
MNLLGESLVILGDIDTSEDIVIDGRVRGHVRADGVTVTIGESGEVSGNVTAREITVDGRVTGAVSATDLVKIGQLANVKARIIAQRFILIDGAKFTGDVHMQKLDAASSLAKYRARQAVS